MTERISGGCLCGDVRFETDAVPQIQILCHCTDCQRVSGSAFYAAYLVPTESMTLTQGETVRFDVDPDTGRINSRRFCGRCGTRLWAELEMGISSVNGMALDDRKHFQPTHNHRPETAPSWCAVNEAMEILPVP